MTNSTLLYEKPYFTYTRRDIASRDNYRVTPGVLASGY